MRYRDFGRLAWKASALGFGTTRLPAGSGQAVRLLRLAIDRGVNHIDTSCPDRDGQAEIAVGKALRDGYRVRVKVATKAPVARLESPAAADRLLGEQLRRLGLAAADFYLFQGLEARSWTRAKEAGLPVPTCPRRVSRLGLLPDQPQLPRCRLPGRCRRASPRGLPGRSAGAGPRCPGRDGRFPRRPPPGRLGPAVGLEAPGGVPGRRGHGFGGRGPGERRLRGALRGGAPDGRGVGHH